jgi:hypothetical protein
VFAHACKLGAERIVSKWIDASYRSAVAVSSTADTTENVEPTVGRRENTLICKIEGKICPR